MTNHARPFFIRGAFDPAGLVPTLRQVAEGLHRESMAAADAGVRAWLNTVALRFGRRRW